MMMASPLESLPLELLEIIADYTCPINLETISEDTLVSARCTRFPYSHLARLVRTSKTLQSHVEPFLYSSNTARTVALYRAIRDGNVDVIHKAIFYGASPNLLEVWDSLLHEDLYDERYSWHVPALHLALKFRQPAAFQILVELGADVSHPALWGHSGSADASLTENSDTASLDRCYAGKKFVQYLCKPCNEESLRLLLREASAVPEDEKRLGGRSLVIRQIPLVSVIEWASPDLVILLLDGQADPNQLHPRLGHQFLSPLSTAILARAPEVFKLLIGHGADINGKDVTRERRPMHIPMIAAATQLLQSASSRAMMQLCLDHGANINRPCHERPLLITPERQDVGDVIPHVCTTALLEFLSSIESWHVPSSMIRPVDGLKILLQAGASAVSPPSRPIERRWNNPLRLLHDRTYAGASSTVELLLDKWGLEYLNESEFFQVVELLIRHGAARPFFARILVKYDSVENPEWANPEVVSSWQRLLDLLISDLKASNLNIDAVLRRVITDKGRLRSTVVQAPWCGVGAIGRASINALIAAGANINACIDVPFEEATSRFCDTALQEVCAAIIHTDGLHDEFHDHTDGQLCEYSLMNERTYSEWFAFLVSKGADPYIENTHSLSDGDSAINTMLSPMKEGRAKLDGSGSLEKQLMRLVAVLQETSEPLVYNGPRERYSLDDVDWIFTWTPGSKGRSVHCPECRAR